jgi:hypothetical protein
MLNAPIYYSHKADAEGIIILITVISCWITGVRMRRRIKKDLGRAPKESDLCSIETWMKVDEVEERKSPYREWVPRDDYDLTPGKDLVPEGEKPIELFSKQVDRTKR